MTQTVDFPAAGPLDPDDAADAIRDAFASFCSTHLGASRPAYITKGGFWAKDVSSTIIEIYFYDGTSDILVFYFNPTTHALTAASLADNQVTLAKLQQIATARFLGRSTSGTGNVEALTAAQVMDLLPDFTGDSGSGGIPGRVPAPAAGDAAANKFLKANGAWAAPPSGLDPGAIMDFAMNSAPTGWLACYGQAVSRATYAALYAAIGDTWGAGNGSTTFNLPDLRGRVRAGWDNMGGSSANRLTNPASTINGLDGDTFAATGGHETHSLTGVQNGPHTHTIPITYTNNGTNASNPGASNASSSTGSSGSGDGHNNVQPTAIVLTCIKI